MCSKSFSIPSEIPVTLRKLFLATGLIESKFLVLRNIFTLRRLPCLESLCGAVNMKDFVSCGKFNCVRGICQSALVNQSILKVTIACFSVAPKTDNQLKILYYFGNLSPLSFKEYSSFKEFYAFFISRNSLTFNFKIKLRAEWQSFACERKFQRSKVKMSNQVHSV